MVLVSSSASAGPRSSSTAGVVHGSLSDDERTTQELRLALTFTGGVSLAVWMGGVAHEIDQLVRASDARAAAQSGEGSEAPSSASYGALLELMDTVVCVDVISGTSAGGINAALLGLANSQRLDLHSLRGTWVKTGKLSDLLRDPFEENPPSLMQGDGKLLTGLNEAIAAMHPRVTPVELRRHTDVFITTTLLSPENNRFVDDYGTEISDADHHGLFHFTTESMASTSANAAIALAARSSAAFPGAFEPSFVPISGSATGDHPDMKTYSTATRSHWAADGGLLANRPIAPVLESIFDQGAEREVRRALLYIVPTGRIPAPAAPDVQASPLGLADSLMRDVVATLNQSIAADLEDITTHNDRTRSAADTRLRMAALGARLGSTKRLADEDSWRDYRTRQTRCLAEPLVKDIVRGLGTLTVLSPDWEAPIGSDRDEEIAATVVRVLTAAWPEHLPVGSAGWTLGTPVWDSARATLLRLLRLGFILASNSTQRRELATLAGRIKQADESRRTTQEPVKVTVALTAGAAASSPLEQVAANLAKQYAAALVPPELERAWQAIDAIGVGCRTSLRRLLTQPKTVAASSSTVPDSLQPGSRMRHRADAAAELSTYLAYLGSGSWSQRLLDLHVVVRSVLPALVHIEQPVQLIQVSADTRTDLDPVEDRHTAEKKLTGMQFHHFGAFYKDTWRANDWMWGRMDGCGWLTHILFDPRRIMTVLDNLAPGTEDRRTRFERELMQALGQDEVPDDVHESLAFLSDESVTVPASLPRLSLWAAALLQSDIVAEELTFIADLMDGDPDCKPTGSAVQWRRNMAQAMQLPAAEQRAAIVATLASYPVTSETIGGAAGTPLFMRTLTQSVAVATAAATSLVDPPAVLRPAFALARTITQGAYVVTAQTKASRRVLTWVGLAALVFGTLAMLYHAVWLGFPGIIVFGVGAMLLACCLGTGLLRGFKIAFALAVILLCAAPWLPYLSDNLFPWLHKTPVTWLQKHHWVWPVLVLFVLLPPMSAVVSGGRALARRSRSAAREPATATQPAVPVHLTGVTGTVAQTSKQPDEVRQPVSAGGH